MKDTFKIMELEEKIKHYHLVVSSLRNVIAEAHAQLMDGDVDEAAKTLSGGEDD